MWVDRSYIDVLGCFEYVYLESPAEHKQSGWSWVHNSRSPNKMGKAYTPPKTIMTIDNPPFEDLFPIENGWVSNAYPSFSRGVTVFRLDRDDQMPTQRPDDRPWMELWNLREKKRQQTEVWVCPNWPLIPPFTLWAVSWWNFDDPNVRCHWKKGVE